MGVYLSSPVTEKISADRRFGKHRYGVSSMQGWRMTQEDSHNCIPDFDQDTDTSYFAVYDGHGGAEVAQYCSAKLPDFLKSTLLYKDGQLAEALQEAFLGFDATLRGEEVIKELKSMAGVDDEGDEEEDDGDPVGRTEADLLRAEADIPIEELVAKYGEGMTSVPARKFQKNPDEKFLSPMIRAKRTQVTESAKTETSDSNNSNTNNSASSSGVADSLVTRLDDKLANGHADNENNLNTEKELREAESVTSDEAEAMETNTDSLKAKSIKDNVDSCVPDSSEVNNSIENVNNTKVETRSNIDSTEADSTSVSDYKDTDAKAKSHREDKSESMEDSTPSSSSDGPSGSAQTFKPESSGSGEPSGSSGPSASKVDESEPSGSGLGPSGSASTPGSSGEGPSGSGAGPSGSSDGNKTKEKTVLDEEYDSDDDSSDDNEYMEDSEEEEEDDEDEDEDDEELDEEEKQRIGGIFSKVIAGHDEEDGHIEEPGSDSGCTAVVALLRKDELVVANAGDSRCVLCRDGRAIDLSVDHKPEDDDERKRIEAAGGKVTADGRVNGGLNLSRAIGDHWYKRNDSLLPQEQMISALPDILSETIGEQDEFIVIACDGIWNYMTSQEVVDFVKEQLKDEEKRNKPSLICEEMFDHCLAPNTMGDGTGCDNMTCIIVLLNYNKDTKSSKQTDCSEADSSTKEESSEKETRDTGTTEQQEQTSSSSLENQQQESSSETEKPRQASSSKIEEQENSDTAEKQQESSNGKEKRPRENCSVDSPTKGELQPEKRARLEDSQVT